MGLFGELGAASVGQGGAAQRNERSTARKLRRKYWGVPTQVQSDPTIARVLDGKPGSGTLLGRLTLAGSAIASL